MGAALVYINAAFAYSPLVLEGVVDARVNHRPGVGGSLNKIRRFEKGAHTVINTVEVRHIREQ